MYELEKNLQKIQIKMEIPGIWSSVFCFGNLKWHEGYPEKDFKLHIQNTTTIAKALVVNEISNAKSLLIFKRLFARLPARITFSDPIWLVGQRFEMLYKVFCI